MTFINRIGASLVAVSLLFAAGSAFAQHDEHEHEHEHVDVLLYSDGSGNLGAGSVDVDELEAEFDHVVFEVEAHGDVLSAGNSSFQSAAPGFYSMSDANVGNLNGNDNLPGNAAITIDFLVEPTLNISLAYWDESLEQFSAPTGSAALTVTSGDSLFGSLAGTNEVLGAAIGTTSGTGAHDEHFDFDLSVDNDGVYLAYAQANVAGLNGPSNPFWLLFATIDECEETDSCSTPAGYFNGEYEHQMEEAVAYVESTLVPEPGTGMLFGLGLMGLARGSRRPRF